MEFIKYSTCMLSEGFQKSVDILLIKPHLVNKRVWGSKTVYKNFVKSVCKQEEQLPNHTLSEINLINEETVIKLINKFGFELSGIETDIEVFLMELLPKNYDDSHAFQLVIKQLDNVSFYNVTPVQCKQNICPDFKYSIQFCHGFINFNADCEPSNSSFEWLKSTLIPQFVKWGEQDIKISKKTKFCSESLSLVSHEKYYQKYNELKIKYGKEMVKIWPECTDPTKFVYEDVAIASYLLLLWEEEREQLQTVQLQSFVDLGCGNGLLVYILAMEGHKGVGVDVRKRQIWDLYPSTVHLEEKTITPSDVNLFPDADWIIGNHSDELTPWIPVVAARSSYKCKFFLLPCCAYNFDGTKYQRQNSSKSQYTEYLEHIMELCQKCGFNTKPDRLKIPSTKRICLVGRERTYKIEDHSRYIEEIQHLLDSKSSGETPSKQNDSWIDDFKPRTSVERVRNCTKMSKATIEFIVESIAKNLLKGCKLDETWSPGEITEINKLIELIPADKLRSLKSECGGLQTLLRNNHNIFKVQGGKVQLRYPKTIGEVRKKNKNNYQVKIKQKPCWFYINHPQGCPLVDAECSYRHENS